MSEENTLATTSASASFDTSSICSLCRAPKLAGNCDLCDSSVCKNCLHFLEESTFSFWEEVPAELSFTHYCSTCQAENVEPALERYQNTMEQAKEVVFAFDTQRRALPILKKSKDKVVIENCVDRDETIMRLAFRAAEQGYTGIIDASVTARKVRNEGYQKSAWTGIGLPANIDIERLNRTNQEI
jgi:hypothetical protein